MRAATQLAVVISNGNKPLYRLMPNGAAPVECARTSINPQVPIVCLLTIISWQCVRVCPVLFVVVLSWAFHVGIPITIVFMAQQCHLEIESIPKE